MEIEGRVYVRLVAATVEQFMSLGYGVDHVPFTMGQKAGNVYRAFLASHVNVFTTVYPGTEFKTTHLMVKGEVTDVHFTHGGDDGGEIVNYLPSVVNQSPVVFHSR